MTYKKYSCKDIGCHADGSLGHEHVRDILAFLVQGIIEDDSTSLTLNQRLLARGLCADLRDSMSDDAAEEQQALDILNEHAVGEGVSFMLVDGDLCLMADHDPDLCLGHEE